MGALTRLWANLKALADNVAALSETIHDIDAGLRSRVGLRKQVIAIESTGTDGKTAPRRKTAKQEAGDMKDPTPKGLSRKEAIEQLRRLLETMQGTVTVKAKNAKGLRIKVVLPEEPTPTRGEGGNPAGGQQP